MFRNKVEIIFLKDLEKMFYNSINNKCYTYMIRCQDNSIYCGYTTEINRRVNEHKNSIGSKYVRARGYKKIELYFELETKSLAMKMESAIKKLNKDKKEKLIGGDISIADNLNIEYKRIVFIKE